MEGHQILEMRWCKFWTIIKFTDAKFFKLQTTDEKEKDEGSASNPDHQESPSEAGMLSLETRLLVLLEMTSNKVNVPLKPLKQHPSHLNR